MKSYIEISVEFSTLSMEDKEHYLLNVLSLDELKLFGEGWTSVPIGIPTASSAPGGWSEYIDYFYKKRVSENRNNKLDQLGI